MRWQTVSFTVIYLFIYLRDDRTFRPQEVLKQMGFVLYSFLENNGVAELAFTLVVCKRSMLLSLPPSLSQECRLQMLYCPAPTLRREE